MSGSCHILEAILAYRSDQAKDLAAEYSPPLTKDITQLPATEKDTDDAVDQPPTSHAIWVEFPRSWPICATRATGSANPHAIGQTYDNAKNCFG